MENTASEVFCTSHLAELKALEKLDLQRNYLPFARFTIRLPWAPSVNNAYPTGKHGKRFPSKVLANYKRDVWRSIYDQKIGRRMHAHPLTITITQHSKSDAGDPDNGIKAVLDALVQCNVIADDNRKIVKRITVEDGSRSKNPWVSVVIEPFIYSI